MTSGMMIYFKMMMMQLSISSPGGGAAAEPPILFRNVQKMKLYPGGSLLLKHEGCKTLGKRFALSAVAIFTAE